MALGQPIEKKTLQRMVYENLHQAILERTIEPGATLHIKKLAEEFDVSAMPVREALRHLEAEGMVTFTSNRRIVVNQLSEEELHDIYMLRIPLEEMALLKTLNGKSQRGLEYLESLHRQMSSNGVTGAEWFSLNRAFHMKLHEMASSERLYHILQGLWNSMGPYLRIFSENPKAVKQANKEHAQIIQSIIKRDATLGKKALRRHLENGRKAIEKQLT